MRGVLFALFALTAAADDVVVLTESNFDGFIKSNQLTLVEFYAPWCGHCKSLAPKYEAAATALLKNDPPVKIAKVDATEESALGGKYGVRGYPTLKLFRGDPDDAQDYEGGRETGDIIKYMASQAGPSSKILKDVAAVEDFLNAQLDTSVVGFFKDFQSNNHAEYIRAAGSLRNNFNFAETTASGKDYGVEGEGAVVFLSRKYKSKKETLTAVTTNFDSLKTFIEANSLPLVGVWNDDTAERYAKTRSAIATLYFTKVDLRTNGKQVNYVANRIRKVAKNFQQAEVRFVMKDISNSHELDQEYGHSVAGDQYFLTVRTSKGHKFTSTTVAEANKGQKSFKNTGLEDFVRSVMDGKVEPYMKSEAAPATATEKGLTTLVAKNFAEEVDNSGKPALIEFYAPWCGHCKSLTPKWAELASKLADEDVVIAKVDATANDLPSGYDVKGFPTIYFRPGGPNKTPEQYNGAREVDDFVTFLEGKGISNKDEL